MAEAVPPSTTSQPVNPQKSRYLKYIIGFVVLALAVGGGVYAYGQRPAAKSQTNRSTGSSSSQAGNKADASGLVTKALPLECVPKGHDYYRTNNTLAVDPQNANTAYVGIELKGVYKTTDGGTTWTKSDTGVRGYPMESDATKKCLLEMGRIVIDPANHDHLLLSRVESPGDLSTLFSENGGVYESTDAGATWHQLVKAGMNASGSRAIAFDPKNSQIIYYGTNNMTPSYTDGNGKKAIDTYFNTKGILYQTKDAGANWAELPTGAAHGFRALNVAVDPNNSQKLWLFTMTAAVQEGAQPVEADQQAVLASTDGGTTWTSLVSKLPTGSHILVEGMLSPKDGNNVFLIPMTAGTGTAADYISLDGGATWKTSNVYVYAASYDPNDTTGHRLLGYVPYDNPGVYQSLDGGVTWTKYSAVPSEVDGLDQFGVRISNFAWSLSTPATVYMSGSGGMVWKSTDNGKTWKTVLSLSQIGGKNTNREGSDKSRESDTSAGSSTVTTPTTTQTGTTANTAQGSRTGAGTGGGGGAGTGGGHR